MAIWACANAEENPDGVVWKLTPYLSGTASQVRDKLNHETERFMARVRRYSGRVDYCNQEVEKLRQRALTELRQSKPYTQAQADVEEARKALEQARATGTPQDRLDASGRYNGLKNALSKMEQDAIAQHKRIAELQKIIRESQDELRSSRQSLEQALKWRNELLDGIRNATAMKYPLGEGGKGTLGTITPRRIDAKGVLIEFPATEIIKTGKGPEGMTLARVLIHRVPMLITGIDTADLHVGTPVMVDRNFVVTAVPRGAAGAYVVKPEPTELDELFKAIVPLRQIEDPEEKQPQSPSSQSTTRPSPGATGS